jgi:hypothetical protein
MLAERYDIQTYAQGSLNLGLTVYSDDAGTTLQNLTSYSASFRIMPAPASTPIVTLTSGSGITLGGSAGTIQVQRTPAQIQALGIDTGAYDLTITDSAGTATVLLQGSFTVVNT